MRRWGTILLALGCLAGGQSHANAGDIALANAQLFLDILGFDAGPYDGVIGGRTTSALTAFMRSRGKEFDGEFGADELDEIYAALDEVPYNGRPPRLNAADGRTSYERHEFDFPAPVDLAALLPELTELRSLDSVSERLRALPPEARGFQCGLPSWAAFPAAGQTLHTYATFREFETTAQRNPHRGNRWVEELQESMSYAGARLAARDDPALALEVKQALLAHSAAGSALDVTTFLDPATRRVIVAPDYTVPAQATQGIVINYLLARPQLKLSPSEQEQIETWLNRLLETYIDSFNVLNGEGSIREPRAVELIGRAYMIWGLLRNDVGRFNEGARQAAISISLTREDGSHRFGASRGNRVLWYQGVMLSNALADYLLMESQGIDVKSILLPTISRMADYWGRGWHDNTTLFPYAQENNAVYVGSDYRLQEARYPSPGIEFFLGLQPDAPVAGLLRAANLNTPEPIATGETFNMSCIGLAYADPSTLGIEPAAPLTVARVNVLGSGQQGQWQGYSVLLNGVSVDGAAPQNLSFEVFTDFSSDVVEPENLILVRMVIASRNIENYAAQMTEFANCSEIAFQPGQVRLHFGVEVLENDCILDR
ncbi:MAG: peptidoglycan-binding domain-containing protein, partial [Cucumibacter sp.]